MVRRRADRIRGGGDGQTFQVPEQLFCTIAGATVGMETAAGQALRTRPAAARQRAARGHGARERWYRSPILWLALAVLAASVAACIVTIAIAVGQPGDASPAAGDRLLNVPSAHRQADLPVPDGAALGSRMEAANVPRRAAPRSAGASA